MTRPVRQVDIENLVAARASDPCWDAPERDLDLLRSELAGCRKEIAALRTRCDDLMVELAQALDAEAACADDMHAANLARTRIGNWINDGGMVHVSLLAELLGDMGDSWDS